MSYSKKILIVAGEDSGGYSEIVKAVNAVIVEGTPTPGTALVVNDEGRIGFDDCNNNHAVRVLSSLPINGNYDGEVIERNAGDADDGYYKWSATKSVWTKIGGLA